MQEVRFYFKRIKKKGRPRLFINPCPCCGREGFIQIERRKLGVKVIIWHWHLYGEDRRAISSMRKRNDKCILDYSHPLYQEVLRRMNCEP